MFMVMFTPYLGTCLLYMFEDMFKLFFKSVFALFKEMSAPCLKTYLYKIEDTFTQV